MNKLMKAILVVVTLFASSAFAQDCINGGYIMGRGQQCWNHVNVDNGNGVRYGQPLVYANEQQMVAAQVRIQNDGQYNGQHVGNQQQFQLVQRERECTDSERHQRSLGNAVAGMVLGGGVGYLRDNNRNSAGKGALIGALVLGGLSEVASCRIRYTERVAIGNQNLRQVVGQQSETQPSDCEIEGEHWKGLSRNDCRKLAKRFATKETVSEFSENQLSTPKASQETSNHKPISVGGNTCAVLQGEKVLADFLSNDPRMNPLPNTKPVSTGPECEAARLKFAKK